MNKIIRLAVLSLVLPISACVTAPPLRQPPPQAVGPEKARIIVTRSSSFLFLALDARITVNGQIVAAIPRGGSSFLDVAPGYLTITADHPTGTGVSSIGFTAKPGYTYDTIVVPGTDALFNISLRSVDPGIHQTESNIPEPDATQMHPSIASSSSEEVSSSPDKPVNPLSIVSQGSGFWVNTAGLAVTNAHVVSDCEKVTIYKNRENVTAEIEAIDTHNDLALLRAEKSPRASVSIRTGTPSLGQAVWVAGYPLSGILAVSLNLTSGTVSSTKGLGGDPRFVQVTAPVQSGNSGGPLLDDSGAVIGVVVSKLDALGLAELTGDLTQNVNFALKAAVLRAFLETNSVKFRIAPSSKKRELSGEKIAEIAGPNTLLFVCWR